MRWRYILPGGRSPFRHRRGKRTSMRKRFDFGPGRNAALRLGCYSYALAMVVLLLLVKVVTHQ
jgi:hypothetical protein